MSDIERVIVVNVSEEHSTNIDKITAAIEKRLGRRLEQDSATVLSKIFEAGILALASDERRYQVVFERGTTPLPTLMTMDLIHKTMLYGFDHNVREYDLNRLIWVLGLMRLQTSFKVDLSPEELEAMNDHLKKCLGRVLRGETYPRPWSPARANAKVAEGFK